MGKNSLVPFKSLFKPFASSWPWPSCNQPRTPSFHLLNSPVQIDTQDLSRCNDSCFAFVTSSFEPESFSTTLECSVEAAMQAVSSNRLFFDGGKSCKQVGVAIPFEGSIAVEMESEDLYKDFSASMKEMVEAGGGGGEVKDLVWLEEMLGWYLRMNEKWTHEFIIKAYVVLVQEMMGSNSNSNCSTCRASLSCSSFSTTSNCASSSSYFSCLTQTEEVEEE